MLTIKPPVNAFAYVSKTLNRLSDVNTHLGKVISPSPNDLVSRRFRHWFKSNTAFN
ncbi:hypothetical protein CLV58_14131 [Spirosoma oryzae]|uniref:Uncharacterized protein n=1 Tax=Spirosoma oryzae TaxID=1469603 RepID=A0A2T0RQY1_9BACT|nr:hypothetical protein CLV58_14131 [Spirosoma oryzae]